MDWQRFECLLITGKGQWDCQVMYRTWQDGSNILDEIFASAKLHDYLPQDLPNVVSDRSGWKYKAVDNFGYVATCRFQGKNQVWILRLLALLIELREDEKKLGVDYILRDGLPVRFRQGGQIVKASKLI